MHSECKQKLYQLTVVSLCGLFISTTKANELIQLNLPKNQTDAELRWTTKKITNQAKIHKIHNKT